MVWYSHLFQNFPQFILPNVPWGPTALIENQCFNVYRIFSDLSPRVLVISFYFLILLGALHGVLNKPGSARDLAHGSFC